MSHELAVVHGADAFDRLESDWRELSLTSERPSVFSDVDWHRTWWQVYARSVDRLHIVTLREEGRLVALLPLYCKPGPFYRGASLMFIGTGEARSDEVATEYADVLLAPDGGSGATADRVARIVDHLEKFAGWRSIELRCLLDDALLLAGLRERVEPQRRVTRSAGLRYRVDLADGEAAHLERLGRSRVKRLTRSRRAAERDGGLQRHPIEAADTEAGLAELAQLSRERHGTRERRSVFESLRFRRFHRLLAERWVPGGQARLVRYDLAGEPVAMLYAFRCRDALHYYQSGFRQSAANRYMPLTLAHLGEMQAAREQGLRWYDLMRGEPPCYKDDFGCETQPMINLHAFASPGARRRFELRRRLRAGVVAQLARHNIRRR